MLYKSSYFLIDNKFTEEVKAYNDGNFYLAGQNLGVIDYYSYFELKPVDYRDDKAPAWFFGGVYIGYTNDTEKMDKFIDCIKPNRALTNDLYDALEWYSTLNDVSVALDKFAFMKTTLSAYLTECDDDFMTIFDAKNKDFFDLMERPDWDQIAAQIYE